MEISALNKDYFDNYGNGGYDKNYKQFGFNLPDMLASFKRNNLNIKSILDAGCATGKTVEDMRNKGLQAYGIEIAECAVAKVPQSVKKYCKQMDIRDIGKFKKDSFDCVFCNSAMYLDSEEEIFKLFQDIYKISKCLYIINPYADIPYTIPADKERKFIQTKKWWLDNLIKNKWYPIKGTDILCIKL